MLGNPNAKLRSARVADHAFNQELAERTKRGPERLREGGYEPTRDEHGRLVLVKQ